MPINAVFKFRPGGEIHCLPDIVTRKKQPVYIHMEVICDGNILLTIVQTEADMISIIPNQR